MDLKPGAKLGPYEIVTAIGKGGMGEVWKARDPRLDRTVAIKTSVANFSERFEREARAVAALNHPHICTLYDVGPDYLVMEYVEGSEIKGPLPLDQALKYAIQLASALEAAHRKGITHRDLKPANILVTKAGVKVLDFGLAKIEQTRDAAANDATLTRALTQEGSIVGTLQYMAPEQLQGKVTDVRADIFSFGCVLYEMLTGKRAFDGTNTASVIAAILERTAPTVAEVAPAGLDWALRLCLAKDPDERWQSARDVRATLERVTQAGAEVEHTRLSPRVPALAWIAAGVFALVAVATSILYFRATSATTPETRLDIVTPPTGAPASFALSPDGRRIAYVATVDGISRLWMRPLDSTSAQPLPGTEGALNPFWSPDSRSLGFLADRELKRIDLGGGQPQTLASVPPIAAQGTWSAEEVILFGSGASAPLSRISASGGQAVVATKLDNGQIAHRAPRFLPGGRQFLFMADGSEPAIWLGSLDGGQPRRLTAIAPGADSSGEYLAPGWLIRVRQNALVAQRFDAGRGQLSGDSITLAPAVGVDPRTLAGCFSVSPSGMIAWRAGEGARRQLIWFNRSGQNGGAFGAGDPLLLNPELSPDGTRAAVTRGRIDTSDVWIQENTRTSRFTFDPADDRITIWSPDGVRVVFASNRKGHFDLYQKATNGTGGEDVLLQSTENKFPNSWSPDGRSILYWSAQNNGDLMVLPLAGERKPFPFLSTPFNEEEGVFSPDGKWVAYASNESGRFEVYVRPYPGPGGQWQVSTGGGNSPRWRADGQELYYVAPDAKLMAAAVAAQGGTFRPGTPEALFQTHMTIISNKQQYDVARDGRFLIDTELTYTSTEPIHLLLNWEPPSK